MMDFRLQIICKQKHEEETSPQATINKHKRQRVMNWEHNIKDLLHNDVYAGQRRVGLLQNYNQSIKVMMQLYATYSLGITLHI